MSETFSLPKAIFDAHSHLRSEDDGSKLVENMDTYGIETTLVMGGPTDHIARNEKLVEACRRYPGRLVGGAFYEPREGKKAIDALKHFNAEGLRIVKLFPNLGYYPDDEAVRPFFDTVAELGMAVLSHCGWLGARKGTPHASYYARPERFEKLINTYRDTVFIMAHMGGISGFLESVMLTTRTPNAYVDCAPGQGLWALEHGGAMAAGVPPEKLMWGADCCDIADMLKRYTAALEKLGYGPHFDKIFYGNARDLFEKLGVLESK